MIRQRRGRVCHPHHHSGATKEQPHVGQRRGRERDAKRTPRRPPREPAVKRVWPRRASRPIHRAKATAAMTGSSTATTASLTARDRHTLVGSRNACTNRRSVTYKVAPLPSAPQRSTRFKLNGSTRRWRGYTWTCERGPAATWCHHRGRAPARGPGRCCWQPHPPLPPHPRRPPAPPVVAAPASAARAPRRWCQRRGLRRRFFAPPRFVTGGCAISALSHPL